MGYGYYPGCSLSHTAHPYDQSTRAIAQAFDLAFDEIDDWNCCGATEYLALNRTAAYALVGRNLALAAAQNGHTQLVAPCSACYQNLRRTDYYMGKDPRLGAITNEALAAGGLSYAPGTLTVRHLFDVIYEDVGRQVIRQRVTRPLTGLRIAPYYGCLMVRPGYDGEAGDDPEQPMKLDWLLQDLGAEVVPYSLKAHCCGGHMTQISAETAYGMIDHLLHTAAEHGADMLVTVCPMCQLNLDAYQPMVRRSLQRDYELPVLYFTQALGLAIGLAPAQLGIGREIVPAQPALDKIGGEPVPKPVRKKRSRKGDPSLPMPRMESEA